MTVAVKRTTVILGDSDQDNLSKVSALLGEVSDVEAIRRSLRLTRELLEGQDEQGGEIILQKGNKRQGIRFL